MKMNLNIQDAYAWELMNLEEKARWGKNRSKLKIEKKSPWIQTQTEELYSRAP